MAIKQKPKHTLSKSNIKQNQYTKIIPKINQIGEKIIKKINIIETYQPWKKEVQPEP